MARSEARLLVDIWNDPDFRALSPGAQWTFMFILSQRDLAHDGVIALRETRWSRASDTLTAEKLAADLDELHTARFVVLDRDEQELLMRSFLRRDKVYRQPNVLRAAADHLPLVSSERIRHALAVELARIACLDDLPEASAPVVAEMRAALPDPDVFAGGNPSDNPSDTPSPKGMQLRPGERSMVTDVSTGFPVLRSSNSAPSGTEGGPGGVRRPDPPKRGTRLPDGFEPTQVMIEWARENAPTTNRTDHDTFVDHWRSIPGQRGVKLDWNATWRNWMRREHQRRYTATSNGRTPREATSDRAVTDALRHVGTFGTTDNPEAIEP